MTLHSSAGVGVVVAMAAVDDEDGVQWRRKGGRSMAVAAFDGNGGRGYG